MLVLSDSIDLTLSIVADNSGSADVINLIAALPEVAALTLTDEATVTAAVSAYDALGTAFQQNVTNIAKLIALQARLNELKTELAEATAKANEVIKLIAALPTVSELTREDDSEVSFAESSYISLDTQSQAIVNAEEIYNYNYLNNISSRLKVLWEEYNAKMSTASELIFALSDTEITLESGAAISAARSAYDALSEAQKALVSESTKSLLFGAESQYAEAEYNYYLTLGDSINKLEFDVSGASVNLYLAERAEGENGGYDENLSATISEEVNKVKNALPKDKKTAFEECMKVLRSKHLYDAEETDDAE